MKYKRVKISNKNFLVVSLVITLANTHWLLTVHQALFQALYVLTHQFVQPFYKVRYCCYAQFYKQETRGMRD